VLVFPPPTHLVRRVLVIYLPRTCVYQPLRRPRQMQATVAHFCFRVLLLSSDGLTTNRACCAIVRLPGFALLCFCPPFSFASADRLTPRCRQPFYVRFDATDLCAAIAGRLLVSPMPQDCFALPHTPRVSLTAFASPFNASRAFLLDRDRGPFPQELSSDSPARSPPSSLQFPRS